MRDDRLARALLRLYPRAWRARYGDEFLALVDDQGLSWRGIVDVVAAACVERVRSIVSAMRDWDDPASLPSNSTPSVREWIADRAALFALVGAAVLALGAIGVPYPPRRLSLQFVLQLFLLDLAWHGRFAERVARSCYDIATAAVVTGFGWLTAFIVTGIGAPPPTEPMFALAVGVAVGCAALRWLDRVFRPAYRSFRRPGDAVDLPPISTFEVQAWSAVMFTIVVTMAMMDTEGQTYWSMAFMVWMFIRFRRFRRADRHTAKRVDDECHADDLPPEGGSQGSP